MLHLVAPLVSVTTTRPTMANALLVIIAPTVLHTQESAQQVNTKKILETTNVMHALNLNTVRWLVFQRPQDSVIQVSTVSRGLHSQSLTITRWEQSAEKVTTAQTVNKLNAQVALTLPLRALQCAITAPLASTVTMLMARFLLLSAQQVTTAPSRLRNPMCAHSVLTLKHTWLVLK